MSDRESARSYQVLARRFRPTGFGEMVGQDEILQSLRSALSSDRIPHGYLFAGSRGVGKTTSARILARALNCDQGPTPDPCGECEPCRSILEGRSPDVIEIDAASNNGVADIRELRERVGIASMGSRYKVYILDEAHMMSTPAWNAFLKTLEEPPPGVVFILATTMLAKVPDTIRSRCQVLHFRRIGISDIRSRLIMICDHESVSVPDEVLDDIATSCRGGMRDAETALERVLPVARDLGEEFDLAAYRRLMHRVGLTQVFGVVQALLGGESSSALRLAAELVDGDADEQEALGEILGVLRALLLLKVDGPESELVPHIDDVRRQLVEMAAATEIVRLDAMIQAGLLGRDRIGRLEDRRLVLEVTLIRMAQAGDLQSLADLVSAVGSGVVAAPPRETSSREAQPKTPSRAASPAEAFSTLPASMGLKQRLLALVQEKKPTLAATIEMSSIEGPDESGCVSISIETEQRMHRDRLQSAEIQRDLTGFLGEILSREVSLTVHVSGAGSPADKTSEQPRRAPAERKQPGLGAQRVMEKFDGEIMETGEQSSS